MKVIVGIDGREQQADALALGAQLASGDDGELVVACVRPLTADQVEAADAALVREHVQAILAPVDALLEDVPHERRVVADLSAPRGLHWLAEDERAEVLVIGSSHRGPFGRTLLGGTGERVVHGAPCAIAVAPHGYRADPTSAPQRIGVAFDGSPESRVALRWAGEFAQAVGGTVRALQVFQPIWIPPGAPGLPTYGYEDIERGQREEAQFRLDQAVEQLPPAVRAGSRLLRGAVSRVLAQEAEGLDLLVMGSRGYGPMRSVLLGGVSHEFVREAPCPLIVLPRGARHDGAAEADAVADRTDSGA